MAVMFKILIIGGTGFIGKNALEYFGGRYSVTAPSRAGLDIYDCSAVESFLSANTFDAVINAADYRPPPGEALDVKKMAVSRLRGYFNLARCNKLYGRMIFFGSGAEYGKELPIVNISEESFDRIIPGDEYGFCLNSMTRHAMTAGNIINLRLFGIFGKYELWRSRFISNAVCKALYGYPITIRQNLYIDYLYIDDLMRMVEWAMLSTPGHSHYNAVSGTRRSLLEIAGTVKKVTGAAVPIFTAKEGLGSEYTASNKRIANEMAGFKPQNITSANALKSIAYTPFEEAVESLSKYYIMNLKTIDPYYLLYQ